MTIKVGNSPIGNSIFAGTVKNNLWQKNKTDCTNDAVLAVVEHAIRFKKATGEDIKIYNEIDGKKVLEFTLVVKKHKIKKKVEATNEKEI